MKKEILDSTIKEEMRHIPTDTRRSSQRLLRWVYPSKRRERMDLPKEVVLSGCIEAVKKQDPSFEPQYDKEFFRI